MTTLFIGLGKMGDPMVRRYAPTHEVLLYDVDAAVSGSLAAAVGGRALAGLDDLPAGIRTVILMLPNSRIVESVVGLLFVQLEPGALVVDMGSSEPHSTQRLAGEAAAAGIAFVDAPVSGGVAKARVGELSIMVGGAAADRERSMEHLAPLGTSITQVGPSGSGHAAKALNNLLSATNLTAAAEIFTVARTFGIDAAVMLDVVNSSTGRSQATEVKYAKHVLNGTFDSGFSLDLMLKDVAIAQALGAGLSTPITDKTVGVLAEARRVLGDAGPLHAVPLDHTEVVRYVETVNRVELRSEPALSEPALSEPEGAAHV
ncbi:NAD(P)-dependent oxidoreductase [Cryobacterium roopkundense]|uniref:3-hydroxyisobutyrate dehydrogenase n=1 Tax=Cryobacterium roopkundense TaxID=1001240 RepID=A0A7W8ZTG4_9MICO|nr:NAD(P)-dependent oxidoreductase [Cryobacterium roopkundense]MBB5639884.1 3-hydroxyisobutyrate dehydrogenase [Cryobacterium roopkundense]